MKLLTIFLLVLASPAWATWNEPAPEPQQPQATAEAQASAAQSQTAAGGNAQGGNAIATGGDAGSLSFSSRATFRGYYMDAVGIDGDNCLGSVYGGGDNDRGAGFMGFSIIVDPCYFQSLAERETNLDSYARLKCADRKYRNAIAYHISAFRRNDRRAYCIDRVKSDEGDRIRFFRDRAEQRLIDCEASRDRSEVAWRQCIAK